MAGLQRWGTRWVLGAILAGTIHAQVGNVARGVVGAGLVNAAGNADAAWSGVTGLVQHKTATPIPGGSATLSQAERFLEAAAGAKRFYEVYPTDKRSADMKKLEVLYTLQSVQAGAADVKSQALALATAYRTAKSNAAKDRFDVALAADGLLFAEKLGGKRFMDDGAGYEKLADVLYAEFGEIDEVYHLYANVIRTTDVTTSVRVAGRIVANKKATAETRAQAQLALDRSQLLGKAVDLKLTTMGGSVIDLAKANDRPTVVFVSSAIDGPADFTALEKFKASARVSARWLNLILGAKPPVADAQAATGPMAASYCFEAAEFGGVAASKLKVAQTPYVFVVSSKGSLVGYGFIENIPALLQAAAQ